MRLKGKAAIITGGAGGIGSAIARGFAREGAAVIICDVDSRKGMAVASQINEDGGKALFVCADVSSVEQTAQMIEKAAAFGGTISILVTCAAVMKRSSVLESTKDDFDEIFDTNVHGVLNCIQGVLPVMKENGRGKFILLSSMAAGLGRENQAIYSAAAGTICGIMRNAAGRLGQFGIQVNGITPGIIDTDYEESLRDEPEYREFRLNNTPLRRIGRPEDVVGAAVFLASSDADFVTGDMLFVDGGLSLDLLGNGTGSSTLSGTEKS